jgi:transposase
MARFCAGFNVHSHMLRQHVWNPTMHHQNTLLHDLGKAMPRWRFEQLARRTGADHRVRTLPCWSQFVALVFAQLAGIASLRELVAALSSHANYAYHLGLGPVRRSTLAEANAKRPLALYEAVLQRLLGQLRPRLAQSARDALRLVDATTLRLSALSDWARVGVHHNAVKLHLAYDPSAGVPTFFEITAARVNDIAVAKQMPLEAGATYVFDKGYYDFAFWAALDARGCRFVTRRKVNTPLEVIATRPANDGPIRADRIGRLPGRLARHRHNPYPKPVRLITVVREDGKTLDLLTNDLEADASQIAALYKARWQVELFFRWVKQHLRIKRFLGTSEHAVKLQILIALIAYLLLRLAQEALPGGASLHQLARLVKVNLMHRKTLIDLLHPPPSTVDPTPPPPAPQLDLVFSHAHS